MQVLFFAGQSCLSASAIAIQVYLMMTLPDDVLDNLPYTLMQQTVLQIAAAVLAPSGLRFLFALAAAWLSIVIGIVVAGAWVTLVIPIAALLAISTQDDYSILIMLLSMTAYLAIPYAVIRISESLDE